MPISRFLADSNITPEQRHVLELAFNGTLRKLGLVDRSDPICEIVEAKIVEIAEAGVTNAVAIAAGDEPFVAANDNTLRWPLIPFPEAWYAAA